MRQIKTNQKQMIYNRQQTTKQQWDDNDIDFRQDTTNNEKQQITRHDEFQKQYNTTNAINDKIRNETKWQMMNDSNDFQ